MLIEKIVLENYRNTAVQELEFSKGINILYGNNAQGKTNLMEAIYYLAAAKSFRGAKDRELINFEKQQSRIIAEIYSSQRFTSLEIRLSNKPKEIYINRVKIQKMREFMGNFRAVLFTPEHLSLIKGAPAERRSFIDSAICQLKPAFISLLFEYSKILEHRGALLKSFKAQNIDYSDEIEFWNMKLASDAALIIKERRKYIERLNTHSSEFYGEFTSGRERLEISYQSVPEDITECEDIEKFILQKLDDTLISDIKNGTTSCGPHRDDMIVEIDARLSKLFSSQGQQRSAILSMKLAEGEISFEETGEYPVFLFDDILSELDEERQNYILNKINFNQVFITGCIDVLFDKVQSARKIYVRNGIYTVTDKREGE
ncbi:MAG: DNA replication/repair protein RecF [Ruminococcaceae bacterium]|nr:DNA replication/repair protein RecF [Oscillospiraceae bacterium]